MLARLTSIAPDLVDLLNSLSDQQLSDAVAVVVREAIIDSGLAEPDVLSAVDQIGGPGDNLPARTRVEAIAARLDEAAWHVQDIEGDSEQYLSDFRRARAASAVYFALDSDLRIAGLEAVYEAQAALDSIEKVRRLLAA